MQITKIDSVNNSTVTFNGLTKAMSRRTFVDGKLDILKYLKKNPHENTIVGQLPNCIFKKLAIANRPQAIKEIYAVLGECANEIRSFVPGVNNEVEEHRWRRPNSSVEKLKDVFVKYNVLKPEDNFDLKYINADKQGDYKKAYAMIGLDEETEGTGDIPCFKVFHKRDLTPEWHKYKCHGNFAEINSAAFWHKHVGPHTNINRFYCGDMMNAYLIDRYIPDVYKHPTKSVVMYDYGIKNTDAFAGDNGHNVKNGYLFDQGGYRVINKVKNQSKTACYVLKQVKNVPQDERLNKCMEILYDKKYAHLDRVQKQAGFGLSIKHLKPAEQLWAAEICLGFNEPFVDAALAYALKYMPHKMAKKYFTTLMQRGNEKVQVILLNEIPRLSTIEKDKYDDISTPRQILDSKIVNEFYQIGKKYAIPESAEHLASLVHILPKELFEKEVDYLIGLNTHEIDDRLLHKIWYEETSPENYSFDDKKYVLDKIQSTTGDMFILRKAQQVYSSILNKANEDNN